MTVEKEEKIKERIETEEKDEKEEKKGRKKRKALKLVPEFPGPSKNDRKEKIVTVENKKVDKKGFPLITFYQEIKKAKSGRKKPRRNFDFKDENYNDLDEEPTTDSPDPFEALNAQVPINNL